LFLQEETHTWFVKYPKEAIRLPRWFYQWWNMFGAFVNHLTEDQKKKFAQFVKDEKLDHFSKEISIYKFYMKKKINFIIGWNFKIEVINQIRHLCREVKIRRSSPKETKDKGKEETTSTSLIEKRKSKFEIKKELAKLYAELEEVNDNEDLLFLPDNGDMENLQRITQAYLCGSP
jgi:hypothetical protein